ncbi:MAG: hypothetical protein ACO3MJ_06160, partial [Alphaproteobacteria bacterium]
QEKSSGKVRDGRILGLVSRREPLRPFKINKKESLSPLFQLYTGPVLWGWEKASSGVIVKSFKKYSHVPRY